MANDRESAQLARAWIQGWIDGKPDDIPLATDFVHTSPYGTVKGREKYLEWVKPMAAENVANLEIIKILGGEGEAVIWFEMTSPGGVVPSCDWVEVENGEITRITSFYDASVLRKADGTLE
jgi:hypothetical protein